MGYEVQTECEIELDRGSGRVTANSVLLVVNRSGDTGCWRAGDRP